MKFHAKLNSQSPNRALFTNCVSPKDELLYSRQKITIVAQMWIAIRLNKNLNTARHFISH